MGNLEASRDFGSQSAMVGSSHVPEQGVHVGMILFYRARVALFHVLRALGVGMGDAVAVQAFTCVALVEAIRSVGARPVWIDIDPTSLNMDYRSLERAVTPRTKAIIVQHTFGNPAQVDRIVELADSRSIPVIEDCCHVFGSRLNGRDLGTFGVAAIWSFEWGKPVIAGLGGGVLVNDPGLRKRVLDARRSCCRQPSLARESILITQALAHRVLYSPERYWWTRKAYRLATRAKLVAPSFNPLPDLGSPGPDYGLCMSRVSEWRLASCLGRAVAETKVRATQALSYRAQINAGSARFVEPSSVDAVLSRFPILVSNKQALLRAFACANLELADFFVSPVHPLTGSRLAAADYKLGSCPVAESAAECVVSLPVGIRVTQEFQSRAIQTVNDYGRR